MMAHQAPFCASYLIAFTSVPMETAVLFEAAEGGCFITFSLGGWCHRYTYGLDEHSTRQSDKLTGPRRTSITNQGEI